MTKILTLSLFVAISIAGINCTKGDAMAPAAAPAGQGGSMARFTIAGNYLYTVDNEKLKVFSIADPANPVLKKSIDAGFEIETIYPFKDKLFIGSTSVIHIFSIDDPENPQKLSTAISPEVMRRCDPVVAKDSVAFATLRTNGPCGGMESKLVSFDIRNITDPVQRSSMPVTEPYGLGYADSVLYVCDRYQGLVMFNIKDPYNPGFMSSIPGDWYLDVIPYYNTLICWVSDGVILYDISNPATPQFIAKIT
jgi:hypothetical protein